MQRREIAGSGSSDIVRIPAWLTRFPGARRTWLAVCLLATACGESNSPPEPSGQIRVTSSTTGLSADPDGYTVVLDEGAGHPIQVNGTLLLEEVPPGRHALTLTGMATNCHIPEQPVTVLVTTGETTEASFTVTCQGRQAFVSRTPGDIWAINADGSGLAQLTHGLLAGLPRWSPDGLKIAYVLPHPTEYCCDQGIGVMNADGTNPVTVWELSGDTRYPWLSAPSWSPDSRRLVFAAGSPFDGGLIATIRADGSDFQRLTNDDIWNWSPAWSPDGGRIAFIRYYIHVGNSGRYEHYYINTMSRDGTGVTILTDGSDRFYDLAWSPDGTGIAYGAGGALRIFPLDGSPPPYPGDHLVEGGSFPAWSPDGSMIAYEAREGIYLIRPDGTGKRFLTRGAGPTWAP